MANFIHGFTCIQSPFPQTRTKPEPDPKPGFCGLPNPKPGFSKKASGLESLIVTYYDHSMNFVGWSQSMQQYALKIWVLWVSQGWVGCRAPNNVNFENIIFPCKNCLIQSCKILQDDLSGQTVISIVHPHPTTAQNFSYHIYAVF